jgi:hypothetical protein
MGEAAHADQCTRGQVPLKVLEALVTYTMVLVYIRRESGRFDYVRKISTHGAQRPANVLANLTDLGAHIPWMHRRRINFTPRSHAGNEDKRSPCNRYNLRVAFTNRQIVGYNYFFWMCHENLLSLETGSAKNPVAGFILVIGLNIFD